MAKALFALVFLLLCSNSFSQEKISPTEQFSIRGKVKRSIEFSNRLLDSFSIKTLGDLVTVNQRGEVKSRRNNVRGILLKDVLNKAGVDAAKPKDVHSFYFVLVGSDGYKVVLSYSELFQHDNIYIVTQSNGKSWNEIEGRVEILEVLEKGKGHVLMKGLTVLIVESVL